METDQNAEFYEKLEKKGVSRRDFLKYCTALTATMGLSYSCAGRVADQVAKAAAKPRPAVIWLHFSECTGCSEAFLRAPDVGSVILETISVEYHETLMAASGHQAEKSLHDAVEKYQGEFVCVVEGAIATKYNGSYGKVAGRSFLEIAKDVVPKSAATIAIGSCASYGGIAAAKPNPGGYKGVGDALGISPINLPGCPMNPLNLVAVILKYLNGEEMQLDGIGRPLFAYGETVHDNCPRLKYYDEFKFVKEFGSKEAEMGYCLYTMGCRGPETYNNCPKVKFNNGTSFPIQAGHPCIGCSEPNFWDNMTPFYEEF
jgi:[NiFe] hydrogenase small subunit